jgi:hypothetical protein
MSQLIAEILLRLAKVGAATLVGAIVYVLATGPWGGSPSVELALLAWLTGAGVVLLVENSPI